MTTAMSFWDKNAEKYSRSPVKDMKSYEATLARVRAHLGPEDNALEIGCGTGSTALLLADSVKEYTASDISGKMIEIGKRKAQAESAGNVKFLQATLEDVRLTDGAYDVILAFNLLHLIEDRPAALGRIHSLLKPNGVFISKTLCLNEKGAPLFRFLIPVMQLVGLAPYVGFFKIAEWDEAIANAGFEIIETGVYPHPSRFVIARRT